MHTHFCSHLVMSIFTRMRVHLLHVLAFVMFFVSLCFALFKWPLFDMPSRSWKSNSRARRPQCRSHLCALMLRQRLSRPSHGYRCQATHVKRYSPWPFVVASSRLTPVQLSLLFAALMHSCYKGGWMGVKAGVKSSALPLIITPAFRRRQDYRTTSVLLVLVCVQSVLLFTLCSLSLDICWVQCFNMHLPYLLGVAFKKKTTKKNSTG